MPFANHVLASFRYGRMVNRGGDDRFLRRGTMNDAREWIDELVDELKEERDKLRVRVHRAKMDADEEWE